MKRPSFEEILKRKMQNHKGNISAPSVGEEMISGVESLIFSINSVCFKSQSSVFSKYQRHILPEEEAKIEKKHPLTLEELKVSEEILSELKVFIDLGAEFFFPIISVSEIKKQFRVLALKWHPDGHFREGASSQGEYGLKFIILMNAYKVLKNHPSFISSTESEFAKAS